MTAIQALTWTEANQRYLMAALAELRRLCQPESRGNATPDRKLPGLDHDRTMAELRGSMDAPPALDALCETFDLSSFERNVVLTCAGVELDAGFSRLFVGDDGAARPGGPNFSWMLAHLPEAHWSALTPTGPLRYRRLVELVGGDSLTLSPLRIDERILHYLTGVATLDERLFGLVLPVPLTGGLLPAYRELAGEIARWWSQPRPGDLPPVVRLSGQDRRSRREIAAAACQDLGLRLYSLAAEAIPNDFRDLEGLARLWEREAALSHSALLVDLGEDTIPEPGLERRVAGLVESLGSLVLLSSREDRLTLSRPGVKLEVRRPTPGEQRDLWRGYLGEAEAGLDGPVEALIAQFDLSADRIRTVATDALERAPDDDPHPEALTELLWQGCCAQSRARLETLAQAIPPQAAWADLVLPPAQLQTLREIATQVRHRRQVYDAWGFASRSARGLGISVLFAGGSGTGKTMAAEVLARELRLDLYRIDLSQVVSKYIGETEKNLRQVFDAAEDGGTILLFDEADALFGQRSEVKDSHDRYANIEISYLLQRMESYRGLAILTTNIKGALDTAFLRRLRFTVQFPFPDAGQRAEIWRRIFPEATPTAGLAPETLARLNVAGGNIRNMALTAAFLAAEEASPVTMRHLLSAARSEYAKLEKTLTDTEIRGWV